MIITWYMPYTIPHTHVVVIYKDNKQVLMLLLLRGLHTLRKHGALYEVIGPQLKSPEASTSPLEDTPSFHTVPLQVLYYNHMLSAQLISYVGDLQGLTCPDLGVVQLYNKLN